MEFNYHEGSVEIAPPNSMQGLQGKQQPNQYLRKREFKSKTIFCERIKLKCYIDITIHTTAGTHTILLTCYPPLWQAGQMAAFPQ